MFPGPAEFFFALISASIPIAILIGLVFLIRKLTARPASSSAIAILEERLARGEINEEEFARRRDLIRQGRS